jgi:hypothetical protein
MSALYPTIITQPWANGTTDPANVVLPSVIADPYKANQVDGFPVSQETDPNVGGEYIKRNEMNGIFKLYSQILNYMNQGGQITFDPIVASIGGGYDLNTILYCAANNTFQRSLINGNVADFNLNPSFRNDGVHWSTNINVGDITAGSITATGNVVSSSRFSAISNNWEYTSNVDSNIANKNRHLTYNMGIETIRNSTTGAFGHRIFDYTSGYITQLDAQPGRRPTCYASLDGISNSGYVVQSDLKINHIVIGDTSFLVRKDRMVDRYHYHLSGRITGNQSSGAWSATLPLGTFGIDHTKILGTFTGVATLEVTTDTSKGQALGYAKVTNASPILELLIVVTGSMVNGSIAVFRLDFTVTF